MNPKLRKVVITVAILNLAYFVIEFAVALMIGSVSLFADSVDFLEDASINLLIAAALGWSAPSRARLGMESICSRCRFSDSANWTARWSWEP